MRAHVGDVWLWLCRAACPGPGVHVWRRGLSPPTPNPSLCVVKETESGEARAALTIKGVSGLQSSEFRVVHLSQDVRHRAPALPRERALAAERRQRRHVGRSVRAPDCNSIAIIELLSQPGLTHARADAPEPEASDRRAPPPMGTHCASRWAARPTLPVAARSKASKLADGARRTRASLVFRGRLERRGRRGHSRRGRRPEGTAGWVGGTVGGAGGGGEGVVARGEKKDAMPGVAFAAAAAPRRRFCRALASPLTFSSSGLPAISHG